MPLSDSVGPAVVALGGVVVDDVEDHLDARRVQRLHHLLELLHLLAPLAVAGVGVVRAPGRRWSCSPSSCAGPCSTRRRSWTNWCTGISSTAVTPSCREVVDHRLARQAGVGAPLLVGHVGVAHGEALDVGLVDDRLVPRDAGAADRRPSRSTGSPPPTWATIRRRCRSCWACRRDRPRRRESKTASSHSTSPSTALA